MITVEPPKKGYVGTRSFVLYREVSFIWRLKCTGIITKYGSTLYIGMDEVSHHHAHTFEKSDLKFQ